MKCNWNHRVKNTENSYEIWLWSIICERPINVLPRKPGFLRKIRDIVQSGGGGNGVTNFGDIRLLERLIFETGSRLSGTRRWAGRGPDGFFKHVISNKKVGISADLVCWRSRNNASGSIPRCDRCTISAEATEAIVQAHGDHVDVLADPVVGKSGCSHGEARERIVGIAHEQMVVLNAE